MYKLQIWGNVSTFVWWILCGNKIYFTLYWRFRFLVEATVVHTIKFTCLESCHSSSGDIYHDISRIINAFTNKPIHTNITKSEHLALENLRKDKDHIIVTADKGVALVVMDKTEDITKYEALLQDNSVYQHLFKDTSPTIHKELIKFCKTTRITVSFLKQNTPS